jgi:hypothetical protein
MDKGQAKQKLRDLIASETCNVAPPPVNVTLRWFYENRFLPQKEEQWIFLARILALGRRERPARRLHLSVGTRNRHEHEQLSVPRV